MNHRVMNRYWELVDKNGPVPAQAPELGNCWLWRGGHGDGRPVMYVPRRSILVTRVVMSAGEPATIPPHTVVVHVCKNQLCVRRSHLVYADRGEHYRWAKLKVGHVHAMIALRKSGVSYATIGEQFGIDGQHASRIIRGLAWKHIDRGNDTLVE